MLKILFIILLIENFISCFILFSNGMLMTETVKGIATFVHWIILLILIVVAVINYSWIYMIIMPICSFISGRIYAYVLLNTLFKR